MYIRYSKTKRYYSKLYGWLSDIVAFIQLQVPVYVQKQKKKYSNAEKVLLSKIHLGYNLHKMSLCMWVLTRIQTSGGVLWRYLMRSARGSYMRLSEVVKGPQATTIRKPSERKKVNLYTQNYISINVVTF